MSLLGQMSSTFPAVEWAQAHSRVTQAWFLSVWDRNQESLDSLVQLPDQVRTSLQWWTRREHLSQGRRWFQTAPIKVYTDASLTGWGAHCSTFQVQGYWSQEIRDSSSNFKELMAVKLGLLRLQEQVVGKEVLIYSDNIVTVSYLRKQGGTRVENLRELSLQIMSWAESNLISLAAVHIQGIKNRWADSLSRGMTMEAEWQLNQEVFLQIVQEWGSPIIDLFATPQNAKVKDFCSLHPTVPENRLDALMVDWPTGLLYAFPPFYLIPRVLRKIELSDCRVIFIGPWWPRRSWFPRIQQLAIRGPWHLGSRGDLLFQGSQLHPNPQMLNLTAWILKKAS
ncbi:uncharacterized protein [Hyperolius riggenbachi]|uniref:uncharacterized protein n=1 Tax=Hyperolius riggenbachi TaxID=752182 RepID=UPI0035A3BD80